MHEWNTKTPPKGRSFTKEDGEKKAHKCMISKGITRDIISQRDGFRPLMSVDEGYHTNLVDGGSS